MRITQCARQVAAQAEQTLGRAVGLLVSAAEDGMRLDRYVRSKCPGATNALLQKMLRKREIFLEGVPGRLEGGMRVRPGQCVTVPGDLLPAARGAAPSSAPPDDRTRVKGSGGAPIELTPEQASDMRSRVLYRDERLLVLNKPAGLATQGGTGIVRHVDGMLDVLRFEARERPRLVHRLDAGTAGVLLLARDRATAHQLTRSFASGGLAKLYWAFLVRAPTPARGKITMPLHKVLMHAHGFRMVHSDAPPSAATRAITLYETVQTLTHQVGAWVAFRPQTGRQHQIRAHACHVLQAPVLGDELYGIDERFASHGHATPAERLASAIGEETVRNKLFLHARGIRIPGWFGSERAARQAAEACAVSGSAAQVLGLDLVVRAPLPLHMRKLWDFMGWSTATAHERADRVEP